MSTLALRTSDASDQRGQAPLALRYVDLAVLIIALPVFIVADLPLLGYAVCAVAWLVQHAVLVFAERETAAALRRGERRRAMGMVGFTTLARLWIVTAAILLVGLLADREDGLAAGILAAILVTFHLGATAAARLLYPEARARGNR